MKRTQHYDYRTQHYAIVSRNLFRAIKAVEKYDPSKSARQLLSDLTSMRNKLNQKGNN